jgi:hypothetical protein
MRGEHRGEPIQNTGDRSSGVTGVTGVQNRGYRIQNTEVRSQETEVRKPECLY